MARYPDAVWRPLPEATRQPVMGETTQVILHSAVDAPGPTSLYGYFLRGDVVYESHFFVKNDGTVEQYVDTSRTADANRTANARAVSIETEDDGKPDQTPWNERQLAALVKLIDWICSTHGIPREKCLSHERPGIGWHSQWGAPSPWTPVSGKTCPGEARIRQVPNLIEEIARLERERTRPPEPTDENGDDEMQFFVVNARGRGDRWVTNWIYRVPLGGKLNADMDAMNAHKALLVFFGVVAKDRGLDGSGNSIPVAPEQIDVIPLLEHAP